MLNKYKQTPLMLTAMHGRRDCLQKLLDVSSTILVFDSDYRRTCLHYAAYYGHKECLQAILSAARSSPVANSWGFARYVNVRDKNGATPLHLAARQGQPECVHVFLHSGAIVSASTGGYSYPRSTPLHLAARAGSLDCVWELLAWGADRKQTDSSGRIPYAVALKRKHRACAALLDPTVAEPLVWPASLKFINELNQDTKALLEAALMEANWEREKNILKGMDHSLPAPACADGGIEDVSSEFWMGSATATQCGQAFGTKKYNAMVIYLQRSWIVLSIAATFLVPFFILATPFLKLTCHSNELSAASGPIALWFIPISFATKTKPFI